MKKQAYKPQPGKRAYIYKTRKLLMTDLKKENKFGQGQ